LEKGKKKHKKNGVRVLKNKAGKGRKERGVSVKGKKGGTPDMPRKFFDT